MGAEMVEVRMEEGVARMAAGRVEVSMEGAGEMTVVDFVELVVAGRVDGEEGVSMAESEVVVEGVVAEKEAAEALGRGMKGLVVV